MLVYLPEPGVGICLSVLGVVVLIGAQAYSARCLELSVGQVVELTRRIVDCHILIDLIDGIVSTSSLMREAKCVLDAVRIQVRMQVEEAFIFGFVQVPSTSAIRCRRVTL